MKYYLHLVLNLNKKKININNVDKQIFVLKLLTLIHIKLDN